MLHQAKCKKILSQIITLARPRKVILFGSAARGDTHAGYLDFLIVVGDQVDCRQQARDPYRLVHRGGISTDFVVVNDFHFEAYAADDWSVVSAALKEGVILYVAKDS